MMGVGSSEKSTFDFEGHRGFRAVAVMEGTESVSSREQVMAGTAFDPPPPAFFILPPR